MFKIFKKDNFFNKCDFKKLLAIFFQQNYYELENVNFLCNNIKNKLIIESSIDLNLSTRLDFDLYLSTRLEIRLESNCQEIEIRFETSRVELFDAICQEFNFLIKHWFNSSKSINLTAIKILI